MIIKKNNFNVILTTMLSPLNINVNDNFITKHEEIQDTTNVITDLNKVYFYNSFLYNNKVVSKNSKTIQFHTQDNSKLTAIVLNINKTAFTLKSRRVRQYKIISCIGSGDSWIGLGESKNRLFKECYADSVDTAKKYIYNLNFKCNDYKQFKYKGCKFKILNMIENKNNLRIYNNIRKLSGIKNIKLIPYASKTPINVVRSILHFSK